MLLQDPVQLPPSSPRLAKSQNFQGSRYVTWTLYACVTVCFVSDADGCLAMGGKNWSIHIEDITIKYTRLC